MEKSGSRETLVAQEVPGFWGERPVRPNLEAQGDGLALGTTPQALKGHLWFGLGGPTTARVMVWLVPAPSHLNGALSPPSGNALCPEARWIPPPQRATSPGHLPVTVPASRSRAWRKYRHGPADPRVSWGPQRGKVPGRRGG